MLFGRQEVPVLETVARVVLVWSSGRWFDLISGTWQQLVPTHSFISLAHGSQDPPEDPGRQDPEGRTVHVLHSHLQLSRPC